MFSSKLLRLARTMAEFEGWGALDSEQKSSVSFRNHNPLNLRSSPAAIGTRDGFAVFENDSIGMYAAVWDIHQKATGNTRTYLSGESTIEDLIRVWTADSDNIKNAYVDFVEKQSGFARTTKLKDVIR